MPSLRSLFLTFTAAVAAVATAGPSSSSPYSNGLVPRGAIFNPRCDCYQAPLPVVIDDATSKITPLVDQLKSLDSADFTAEKIQPIADEIKSVITDGIGHLNLLAKSNAEATFILSTGDGTLSVSDTATLLAGLFNLVLVAIGAALKLVVSAQASAVITIFADVVISLAEFVNISVSLVTIDGGLLAAVLPLIKTSLGVAINLGVTSCFHFLDIDFIKTATELGVEIGVGIGADLTADVSVSLISIVKTAFATIQPLAEQLKNLGASEANASTIAPIVAEIRAVLVASISQITVLVGQSAEVVLSFEGKVQTVGDAAGAIGELVLALFDGICEVIKVVPASEAKIVVGLFVDLGLAVGQLIKVCSNVITFDGGLIVSLVPIIKDAIPLAITLGITECYDFLGVDWTHIGVSVGITIGAGGVLSTVVGAGTTVAFTATQTGSIGVITGVPPVATGAATISTSVGGAATTYVSSVISAGVSVPTGSAGNDEGDDLEDCDEDDGDYEDGDYEGGDDSGHEHDHSDGGNYETTISTGFTTTIGTTVSTGFTTSVATVSTGVPDSGATTSDVVIVPTGTTTYDSPTASTGVSTSVATTVSTGVSSETTIATGTTSQASSTVLTGTTSGAVAIPTCSAGVNGEVSVSLVAVIQQSSTKITALVEKLKGFSSDECHKDNVQPIVTEIKAVFTAAIEQVKIFIGAKVDVVLASDCNGTVISVSEFATLFGTLINLIFGAIIVVIKTATTENKQIIISIFADLGICIGEFIKVVCEIVTFDGGLTAVLIPIITTSIGVCVTLGIKTSFDFLNIDWTTINVDLGLGVGVGVGAVVSIVTIVNNATTVITPLIEKLTGLGASDCTADNIRPIVVEIQAVIKVAIEQITLLVGAGVEVVLASGSSVISVGDCGKLIGDLINLIFGACGGVLKIVASGEYKVVIGLFVELGICIGDFVKSCTQVVTFDGGLVAVLTPLIQTSLSLCVTLGIKDNFEFLNIDWTQIGVIGVGVGATVSIVTIINNATTTVTPLIDTLKGLSAQDCTADKIGGIVIEIKAVLSFAIEQIKVLVGASVEVVLASGSGAVISVGDCATLVGGLVTLIFEAVAAVLKIVVTAESKAVIAIFSELCILVGVLIQTTISVVTFDGGIVGLLVPIIKASLGVCVQLDITSHFDFLGLDFTQLAIDLGITVGVVVGGGAAVTGSLTTIIADLTTQITPLIDQLKGLKASDCGADTVGNIIGQIKVIIVASTAQIKGLTSATVGCTVEEATAAIGGLLTLIFGALDAVLKVVGVASAKAVFGLCAELGSTVAVFLQACTSVVGGLETALVSLVFGTLKESFAVVIKLAITADFGFLGIDFSSLSSQLGLNLGGVLNTLLGALRR